MASGSIRVSASTAMTSGQRLALIAAFSESALPPFSLSMTTRRGRVRERNRARMGREASVSGWIRGTSYRSNASCRRSIVPSFDPSFTTITS